MAIPLPMTARSGQHCRVGICDWMILKRQKLGEFQLAHDIGADGVEMDMGPLGKRVLFDNRFRNDEQEVAVFKHKADSFGVQIASFAMSGFFAQSFLTRPNYRDLINDCLATMHSFGAKVAFLPLGGSGKEWMSPGAAHDSMVVRLRVAGQLARRAGVVIGIRTALSAEDDVRLLDEVGSKGIRIYYNFQDAADDHRDICQELKTLGRKRIVQIHASNTDGKLLRDDPAIDMKAIIQTLRDIGWKGWLIVERSRDAARVRDVKYNYGANVAYLHERLKD
jgi:L-ribulose-5-phosphate 3-epimerase